MASLLQTLSGVTPRVSKCCGSIPRIVVVGIRKGKSQKVLIINLHILFLSISPSGCCPGGTRRHFLSRCAFLLHARFVHWCVSAEGSLGRGMTSQAEGDKFILGTTNPLSTFFSMSCAEQV